MGLIIMRRLDEEIRLGDDILIKVTKLKHGQVYLKIDAPRDIEIVRTELDKQPRNYKDN